MQLSVPFYPNTSNGNQCMQVTMQGVLDYFLQKKINIDDLDRLTGRKGDYWTYTSQIVGALWELGLDVKYYSVDPLEPYTKDVKTAHAHVRKTYPNDSTIILEKSDWPVVVEFSTRLSRLHLFEQRKLTFTDIENHIRLGHVPLMLIDYAVLENLSVGYRGHFVVVTGFDNDFIFYHESGPGNPVPNRRVSKELFIRAWNATATGNDTVIVFGKREK